MGRCSICGRTSPLIAENLKVCLECIRNRPEEALIISEKAHEKSRGPFNLPPKPPRDKNGVRCGLCANNCIIGEGRRGFCGLTSNINGQLVRLGGTPEKGLLEWYYDPLPTNCVAWWFCPGCTGTGYPRFSYSKDAERGYSNLAVFYGACSLDCLFCQNWQYRNLTEKLKPLTSADQLASKVDGNVSCICYFGGDPSVQMPHAIETSRIALEEAENEKRILRICWETNGNFRSDLAIKAAELSMISGGIIKYDLKAYDENLYKTLCGTTNRQILKNFRVTGEQYYERRSEVPILTASTLLIPGYIDAEEVEAIARFISEIDENIPYTLLAFYPEYMMRDLPTTSRREAERCYRTAKKYLKNVRVGNIHLLS